MLVIRTPKIRNAMIAIAASALLATTFMTGGASASVAAGTPIADQIGEVDIRLSALVADVSFGSPTELHDFAPLTDEPEGATVTRESNGVRLGRGADYGLYAVSLADGRAFTIFVPAAAESEETDFGLAYAHSGEATRLAWNRLSWPSGTSVLLDGGPMPVDLSAGSVLAAGLKAGTPVQFNEPLDPHFLAFADRVAAAMPPSMTVPSTDETQRLQAALDSHPQTAPEPANGTVLAIVPTPEQYVTGKDIIACADIPLDDPAGQCPAEVASASSVDAWQPSFATTRTAVAVPVSNVIMTRPVFKSFIPEATTEVPLGLCDASKIAEIFAGDNRGPGVDQPSARTTAFYDFSWGPNTGLLQRRIGETRRLASLDRFFRTTGLETKRASEAGIQGTVGNHYATGGGAVEGFRDVRFKVAVADPFCTLQSSIAVNQNNGQVGGTAALYANRPPFWQKDGSMGTGFRHDAYPAHEYYNYSYLPGLRVTNPVQYYSLPTSKLGPACLLANPFCQSIRMDIVSP